MSITLIFLTLATFASALSAGLFYAYHWTAMPGLNAADPMTAINALRSINVVITTRSSCSASSARSCSARLQRCSI